MANRKKTFRKNAKKHNKSKRRVTKRNTRKMRGGSTKEADTIITNALTQAEVGYDFLCLLRYFKYNIYFNVPYYGPLIDVNGKIVDNNNKIRNDRNYDKIEDNGEDMKYYLENECGNSEYNIEKFKIDWDKLLKKAKQAQEKAQEKAKQAEAQVPVAAQVPVEKKSTVVGRMFGLK